MALAELFQHQPQELRLSSGARARVEFITPARAAQLLEQNPLNRAVRAVAVRRLRGEIDQQRWCAEANIIQIAKNGYVINGQHRLYAIVESGVTVEMIVIYDAPELVRETVDRGRTRTIADALQIEGHPNANVLAATLRIVIGFARTPGPSALQYELSVHDALDAATGAYADVTYSINAVRGMKAHAGLMPFSTAAALHYLFWHSPQGSRQAADAFFEQLIGGVGLAPTDTVYLLRQRLFFQRSQKTTLTRTELVALVIKAWNRRAIPSLLLRWRSKGDAVEAFPSIQ